MPQYEHNKSRNAPIKSASHNTVVSLLPGFDWRSRQRVPVLAPSFPTPPRASWLHPPLSEE